MLRAACAVGSAPLGGAQREEAPSEAEEAMTVALFFRAAEHTRNTEDRKGLTSEFLIAQLGAPTKPNCHS